MAEIKASGWEPEDFEGDDFEVWPENWNVFSLFETLQTQWVVGFSGRTGLNYPALYPLLDKFAKDLTEWQEVFHDIRVMEIAALNHMASQKSAS